MESIQGLVESIASRFEKVTQDCERHGAQEALVRRDGGAWACPKCHEERVAAEERAKWMADRNATLLKIATIPAKYLGQRFIASTPEQKAMRATMRAFREFVLAEDGPRWASLILTGITGTGKTLAVSEFAESWVRKLSKSCRYITANGMIKEIQASYGAEGKSEEGEILRFVQYDLLILDEIDAKADKENANLLLTEVINRRYNENKPVIVISNQAFELLGQFVGDRVHSRLHENAFIVACTWPDFRRQSPS
jgi:DNA replication protein DnaC